MGPQAARNVRERLSVSGIKPLISLLLSPLNGRLKVVRLQITPVHAISLSL
jgi:hypothetical protein